MGTQVVSADEQNSVTESVVFDVTTTKNIADITNSTQCEDTDVNNLKSEVTSVLESTDAYIQESSILQIRREDDTKLEIAFSEETAITENEDGVQTANLDVTIVSEREKTEEEQQSELLKEISKHQPQVAIDEKSEIDQLSEQQIVNYEEQTDLENEKVKIVSIDDIEVFSNLFEKRVVGKFLDNDFSQTLTTSLVATSSTTGSVARGDDYPSNLKNAAPDTVIDQWRLYNRECTSFTAYRLSSVNNFTIPGAYGNGGQWGSRAKREGYTVDMNPAKGSVAWLDDGGYGHVAWVSNVIGNTVEIEEYNYNWNHNYNKRVVAKTSFTGYIHFKDLVGSSSGNTSGGTTNSGGSLPASGTYKFTSRTGIKAEPKISSADIAYYNSGDSVNYDKTLEADNYQWISYVSYTGVRRYIAVNKLATTDTPIVKGTINIKNKNDQSGTFDVIITNVSSNSGLKEVQVPIWSTQNGQDDIVWYKASKQDDGSYKTSVNISSHKNNRGEYNIHLYYVVNSGKRVGVGGTKITIAEAQSSTEKPTGTISITNKNDQTGTFDVVISNVSSPNGLKEVKVPVWATQNGQDDIVWYKASKQSNGIYKVSIKASNHKNYKGEYNIHLYYVQNDSKMVGVGGTTTNVQFITKPSIPDSGTYTFKGHASIKAEPKVSSPELAYYDAGNSVNYDKVLLSDGHYWISYIAVSGNRRYISIT